MEYLHLQTTSDTHLPFVKELYHSAFPQNERRDWAQLLEMITSVPAMKLELIQAERPIGFIISWKFADWCFIEHFAIDSGNRGKKYGEKVIQDFMENHKLLLEVEPPDSTDAVRRISFYERLGLSTLSFDYRQPCYRNPGVSYRLLLMSNVPEVRPDVLGLLVKQVQQQVYTLL